MKLNLMSWLEVEAYLQGSDGIIIPTGSTEQHGPMGLIGTDALCAEHVAVGAGEQADAVIAPTLSYTPAPFNMGFPGTISVAAPIFGSMMDEIFRSVATHGFGHIYVVNGHGANLAPLYDVAKGFTQAKIRIRSWWDFDAVNALRSRYYGAWEGMHATPSEIAITQKTNRVLPIGIAKDPPKQLSDTYIKQHSGDRHGPPDEHRLNFPDGRVGSHSALARPEHGAALLAAAQNAVAGDYREFLTE